MKMMEEFKQFALKGNVVDMAVGVIIGGAFGKIVSSLVEDIIMPVISVFTNQVNFADLAVSVSPVSGGEPILIKYGMFIQNVVDFLIIAICIFMAVRLINSYRNKAAEPEKAEETAPSEPVPSKEEELLTEIRDILRKQSLNQ